MLKQPLILALDIGTSSVRGGLYDSLADPVPGSSVKAHRSLAITADGGAEIAADEAVDQVVSVIDAAVQQSAKIKGNIAYIASSAFWHSLVGVDEGGKPTTKVLGWADTRSREYTAVLRKRFDEVLTHNRTGARFHSSYWPAKLLWLRREHPDVFAKTARWLSFSDYLQLKLCGDAATSISMASGTGLFDIGKCVWDAGLIKYLRIKQTKLPLINDSDSAAYALSKKFARRWPRLAAARWFPAIGDGAADNIGAGCAVSSRAALMVGTSGAMRVAYEGVPPRAIPSGLWCYRIDRKRVVIGGALSDGGGLYQWLNENLRLPHDAEDQVAKRARGGHGLTFLPYLAGERSLGYREEATGGVLGLRMSTNTVDILQAAMESVADQFNSILQQLETVTKIEEIVATGGALRDSPVWTKIISDTLGRPLFMNDAEESSSRGAVLHVLENQ